MSAIDQSVPTPSKAGSVPTSILTRNLQALAARSPRTTDRLAQAIPADIELIETRQDALSAVYQGRTLASRRKPLDEAERLAESFDLKKAGAVVIMGFGLGHHARAIAERVEKQAAVIIFEPDESLLRRVLEEFDHSDWLNRPNVRVFTDSDNAGSMHGALKDLEAWISVGVEFVNHPPSADRLAPNTKHFTDEFLRVVSALRTTIVTVMMQSDVTIRNTLMNVEHQLTRPGIAELKDLFKGRPAVVVSAGPSLRRNMHLLKEPGIRDRVAIIAVQTVLKPLLEAGIKPHFVTALDYHEVSKRFYEGLTVQDVEGVQLIAESKANAAILDTFPGEKRVSGDDFFEQLIGEELAPANDKITPGATVAHLAYYLARYLGCDPVALIGQDLAFTDGQYYAKHASIHDVWAGELSAFNTLEMMEWQRIARMRGNLHRVTDTLGRPVFTDDQMATYLAQFERDFLRDEENGLTTVDATQGGVKKAHTELQSLSDFLMPYYEIDPLPEIPSAAPLARASESIDASQERLKLVRRDVRTISRRAGETADLLRKVKRDQKDLKKANRLIDQVNALRDEVRELQPAYELVHRINQLGSFKRFKSDRDLAIDLIEQDLDELAEQARRIDRDIQNVNWIGEAADHLDRLLEAAGDALSGGEKLTRDQLENPSVTEERSTIRVPALIPIRTVNGVGAPTDLSFEIESSPAILRTLEALEASNRVSRVIILAANAALAEHAQSILQNHRFAGIEVSVQLQLFDEQVAKRSAVARAFAPSSWRAGLAHHTVWDELIEPVAMLGSVERLGLDSVLIVGFDWCSIDPDLTRELVDRHTEAPESVRLAFSPTAPGLAPLVCNRATLADLATAAKADLPFASIAGLLGYLPARPTHDPLTKQGCVQPSISQRDLGVRAIARSADAPVWFDAQHAPTHVTVEATTDQPLGGRLSELLRQPNGIPGESMSADRLGQTLSALVPASRDLVLTISGLGDSTAHPDLPQLIRTARQSGVRAIRVRTALATDDALFAILAEKPDIVSIDLHADSPMTYDLMHGSNIHDGVISRIESLLESRDIIQGRPDMWIVPHLLRCDDTYEDVEAFFDRWLMICGSAVIDQLPYPEPGSRIEPLGKPKLTTLRDASSHMMILVDGSVPADHRTRTPVANVNEQEPLQVWSDLMSVRRQAFESDGIDAPELWTGWS
ncbi:MAG: 6-hydroxymethylpterin diphosphokinase MptE-like protein [Planctomycetota bacterium]